MKISSNRSNQAFNQEVDNCWNWLRNRLPAACGYSSEILLDRLVQLIAEIGHGPYAQAVLRRAQAGENPFPESGTQIDCNRFYIEVITGRIKLPLWKWLANQWEFLMHWGYCFIAILAPSFKMPAIGRTTLVFGVGDESIFAGGNDERFRQFCRSGPVAPLREGNNVLLQSTAKYPASTESTFSYARNPLIAQLRSVRLGLLGRFQLAVELVSLLFAYAVVSLRCPWISLIGKELPYGRISWGLDRRGVIEAIVITCSAYTNQPIWLRGLKTAKVHMVWYAQNWRPLAYSFDSLVVDLPQLRWIRADVHWVWTHAFARYLRLLGCNNAIEVVGPIVWQMPELRGGQLDALELVIFDTPAFTDEAILSESGEICNYYRYENLNAFLSDVVSLRAELERIFHLPVVFKLKAKRSWRPSYDSRYFEHVERLDSLGEIELQPQDINIYECISSSRVVIAYPFSSVGYIAEALGKPAVYYDPSATVIRQDFCDVPSSIKFVNSREGLSKIVISLLEQSLRT
jgi:hypothetical protein